MVLRKEKLSSRHLTGSKKKEEKRLIVIDLLLRHHVHLLLYPSTFERIFMIVLTVNLKQF